MNIAVRSIEYLLIRYAVHYTRIRQVVKSGAHRYNCGTIGRYWYLPPLSKAKEAGTLVEAAMANQEHDNYYASRKAEMLEGFDRAAQRWKVTLSQRYGDGFAEAVLQEARAEFKALVPAIPYIGGDENHLTGSLIGSVRCLAFYRAMKARGKPAAETGKVLYDAVQAHPDDYALQIPTAQRLSRDELMKRRRAGATRSQERRYAWDWVYEFVEGDGEAFDYGYDFLECATDKFYRAQGAGEFLPFYCFLDFLKCELDGLGLSRTTTLAEGGERCDHRFKEG